MFSFGSRKKQLDVQAFLRRVIDISSPNRAPLDGEARLDSRANRTFPLVVAPWVDGQPDVDKAMTALSKNFSGQGMTTILAAPIRGDELVIGFELENQPYFLLGNVRHRTPLGGGFWQLGIELTSLLTLADEPCLERLLPMTEALTIA
jgi:hypothetical protein